jgi:HK97 family phage major capsid protein
MPELTDDLRRYLYETYASGPRGNSRWVMSQEWMNECRRVDLAAGSTFWHASAATRAEYLLGIPVEVREDAGAPRLEPA